jgi:cyanophycinase
VIVGGALARDHGEVYRRILAGVGDSGRLAVIPTASGEPERSGAAWAEEFDACAELPISHVVPITVPRAELANDPATIDALASATSLFFTGGDQSRIVAVFRPESGDTAAFDSVRRVLDAGGTIAGSSAGAAMMCDPMIRGGRSESALREGARFHGVEGGGGVWIGRGMGFFPFGLVDQHFLARGRLGRLLVALIATGERFGFGIDENSAIDVDLATRRIEAIGPTALLLVDASDVVHEGGGYRDARIALLGNGDVVDGRTGVVRPAEHKRALAPQPARHRLEIEASPWDEAVLTDAIARLGRGEARIVRITSGRSVVVLRTLPETRFWSDARTQPHTVTVANLAFDAGVSGTSGVR